MNAVSGTLLALLSVCVLAAPRRWALLSMVVGTLFLTQGHMLLIGGLNFLPNRILAYLCFLRVVSRQEFSWYRVHKVDWALILVYTFMTVVLLVRPEEPAPLRIAKFLDVVLGYLAFRGLVQDPDDFKWLLRSVAILLIPYVSLLAIESATGQNPFSIVGAGQKAWIREDRLRCFGSFRHPSLLGSLGATFFPLFVALAFEKSLRRRAVLGAILSTAVVIFSNSGGPLSAWATGVVGWLLWPIRNRMRTLRWGMVAAIAILGLLMKAPVWYLIARISSVTGGTGWHRAYLIDLVFRHFERWWLIGLPLKETKDWFGNVIISTGGADITNQYISFGLNGGILCMGLFLLLVYRSFSLVGYTRAAVASHESTEQTTERLVWGLGVMLAVHASNWVGITYWDQFYVIWLLQFASVTSVCTFLLRQQNLFFPKVPGDTVDHAEHAVSRSFHPATRR